MRFNSLRNERFIGIARTDSEYTLLQPPGGGYPAMVKSQEEWTEEKSQNHHGVWGELFEVRVEQMTEIDKIEGVPTLYDRVEINLQEIHLINLPDSMDAFNLLEKEHAIAYIYQRPTAQLKPLGNYWSNANRR